MLYALDDALDTAQCTLSFDYEILEDITDAEILVGGVSAGSISNIEATGHLSFVVESDTVLQGDVTLVLQQGKIRISHLQVERGDMETAWYPFSGDLVTQTTLEQKANELSMQFVATDDENWQEIQRYIRFVDGNILLGAEDSQLVLRLTSERIEFLKSTDMDNPIAYYSSNGFELTDISTIRFGGFRYTPRTSGNLSFTKVVE